MVNHKINEHKKSQAATEYLIISALIIILLSMLLGVGYNMMWSNNTRIASIKAQDFAGSIAKAATLVYQEGKGAKTQVYVDIPEGIINISNGTDYVLVHLRARGDIVPYYYGLDFPIAINISIEKGYYWLNISSNGSHVIVKSHSNN